MATISRSTPNPRLMKAINGPVAFLIERGLGPVAAQLMVLHWTGRKSGRAFSTPVSRMELDGQLFTKTRAGYKHNFVGGGPAELVIDGERRPYTGTVIDSPDVVGQRLRAVLDAKGLKRGARSLGLTIEGDPTAAELAAFVEDDGSVIIDFEPV